MGALEEASEQYKVSLEVKQLIANRNPGDAKAQAELARAFNKVGVNLYNQGDLRGSIEFMRREADIYSVLIAREPKQTQWKQRRATSLGLLARGVDMSGDVAGALALLQEALRIEKELAALDPANVEWQRAVSADLNHAGTLEARRGDPAAAAAVMRESWTRIRAAMRQAPAHMHVAVSAGISGGDYGRFLTTRGDALGIEILQESIRILEKYPDDRLARWILCRNLLFLGEARRGSAALAAWERAERALPLPVEAKSPLERAIWSRLLIHRERFAEAGEALARLRRSGYATEELDRLCNRPECQTRQVAEKSQKRERN
jgi:hypothetical protein